MTSSERRGASERLPWTVTNRYNFQVIMNQYIAEEPLPFSSVLALDWATFMTSVPILSSPRLLGDSALLELWLLFEDGFRGYHARRIPG